MKETVTQSSFSENINGKDYVVSITKCGDGYQLQLQMKAQLNKTNYDDVKLIVVDLFNRFRMDMSDKIVDNKGTAYVVASGSTENLPKKKRGRPKKNGIIATTNDVIKKAKKLNDDYDFFSSLPKDNAFSELGSRGYVFKGKKK